MGWQPVLSVFLYTFPPGSWVNSKSLGMFDWTPTFAQQDRSRTADLAQRRLTVRRDRIGSSVEEGSSLL